MDITNRLWHLLHPTTNGHHQPASPAPRTSLKKSSDYLPITSDLLSGT